MQSEIEDGRIILDQGNPGGRDGENFMRGEHHQWNIIKTVPLQPTLFAKYKQEIK